MNFPFRHHGRGVRRKPGEMNRLEAQYAAHLEARKQAGEVEWYAFEPIKLKLAPSTFYAPDFLVLLADRTIEVHEVKGRTGNSTTGYKAYVMDDAAVKLKVSAQMFPFRFWMLYPRKEGGWHAEGFGNAEEC